MIRVKLELTVSVIILRHELTMVKLFQSHNPTGKWLCQCEAFRRMIIRRHFYGIDPL